MAPQSTLISERQLIDAAKSPLIAFNQKDWIAVRAGITPDFLYDEVPTGRKAQGPTRRLTSGRAGPPRFPMPRPHSIGSCRAATSLCWR